LPYVLSTFELCTLQAAAFASSYFGSHAQVSLIADSGY